MPPASTPCIRICVLDGPLCQGCGRTLDEIGRWSRMSEAERLAIMKLLPGRLEPTAAGPSREIAAGDRP